MQHLIGILVFLLTRGRPAKKYYSDHDDQAQSAQAYTCTSGHTTPTEAQEQQLDEALLGDDEMFLQVLAGAHGVMFTTQESIAISLLAVRYERGEY